MNSRFAAEVDWTLAVSFQPNTDGEHVIPLQKKEGEKWKLFYEFAKIMTT